MRINGIKFGKNSHEPSQQNLTYIAAATISTKVSITKLTDLTCKGLKIKNRESEFKFECWHLCLPGAVIFDGTYSSICVLRSCHFM